MAKCNARTKNGTLCRNGLGCQFHKEHCKRVIRERARLAELPASPPEQLSLFPERKLTREEILALIEQGRREERTSRPGNCGCLG